jgi:hypothetical protein
MAERSRVRIKAVMAGLALGVVGSGIGLATPAAAQDPVYPPSNDCGIRLSASALRPDQTFTITGTQAGAGVPVTLTFESEPVVLATVTTDARGEFRVEATVPPGAEPGVHLIRAQGVTSCAAEVVISRPAVQPYSGSRGSGLAFTGANPVALVLVALMALTVGYVLVAGERRQRTRRSTIRRERRERRRRTPTPTG